MIIKIIGIATFLTLWLLLTNVLNIASVWAPSPLEVIHFFLKNTQAIITNALISFQRIGIGFLIGSFFGIFLGLITYSEEAGALVGTIIEIIRPIPGLAWIPLALIWFGLGETSKVFVIALSSFISVYTNTNMGVRVIDPLLLRAAINLGASGKKLFFNVRLPAALPYILTGLRVGIQSAFLVLIAAEMIGATSGIGWLINDARRYFRPDIMVAGMLIIGFIGWFLTSILELLKRRLTTWVQYA